LQVSGGDRGLTVTQAVIQLGTIRDTLANFKINALPIDLVGFFAGAGIYRRSGEQLRCFHDSFESYLGTIALESEFRQKEYDLLRQCAGNVRLLETWDFLLELLNSDNDRTRLKEYWQVSASRYPSRHLL
jgi:hypothetical protein